MNMIILSLLNNLISLQQKGFSSKSNIAHFINKLSKKVKAISTKGLTKDMITKLSIINGANIFPQEYFKII